MRTAVVHESLMVKGGAERAVLILSRAFNADIWITTYFAGEVYPEYSNFQIYQHPLKSFWFASRLKPLEFFWRGLMRMEAVHKFRKMDLSRYDLVISVGICAKHVPICDSNRRLHYELNVTMEYRHEWLFKAWAWYMKKLDSEATRAIKTIACNSENTRNKIIQFYQRDAVVIHPAVNVKMFKPGNSEEYFLAAERISPFKGIETQLEVFRRVPEQKLLIVGSPQKSDTRYFQRLVRLAPRNVTFRGSVTDAELVNLYSHAKAVVQTNPSEDFGRVPVEAMASGKPCIAVNVGGFKESIVHSKTGILVDPPYSQNLAEAIRHFNRLDFDPNACIERAQLFSEEAHIEKMRKVVASL